MSFQIEALPANTLQALFGMSDEERIAHRARLVRVEEAYAAPCRISLEDASPGEQLILAPFDHQPAQSPYRASGPIFVRKGVARAKPAPGEVPDALRRRLISLRAYDLNHEMIDAEVVDGKALEGLIARFFAQPETAYLHAHYARRGCYAARIERA